MFVLAARFVGELVRISSTVHNAHVGDRFMELGKIGQKFFVIGNI
jgi:hypothetical protein